VADLSIRAMAEQLGVSKSQVARDAKAGMPMSSVEAARAWRAATHDLSRTFDARIDRPVAQTSAKQEGQDNHREAEAGMATGPGAADNAAPGSSGEDGQEVDEPVDEHAQAYRQDRARNERLKADRAEIELKQLQREVVAVRDVEQLEFTAGRIVRDRMEMMPARASADLHALVLSLVPEEHREAVAARLELHLFERRLADLVREALADASKAIDEARRDDDEAD
jgi:hypothetical protein